MFESFGFEAFTAPQAAVVFAVLIGALFGVLAQRTKFCLRRSVIGTDRRAAAGVWLTALAVATLSTQASVAMGWISFADHRFLVSDMPVLAIILGGLMFGAGMVLTRGCVSRLTVLAGSGNLRAVMVLLGFAIVAHATLKGVLAPARVALGSVTTDLGAYVSLANLPGGPWVWGGLIAALALAQGLNSGNRAPALIMAAGIGLLAPLAWVGTGFVLYDDFDPIAMQSLSFTAPAAETLFWTIASTSVPAGFGTGLVGGVLIGALAASLLFGGFTWASFESPAQTGRYMAGATLMGIGGVLAGGCTMGAGISGVPTLSVAAMLALLMIVVGALVMNALLNRSERAAPFHASPLHAAE